MLCNSGTVGMGYEGDTCKFMCDIGYKLKHSSSVQRTCQSNGSWNGSEAKCNIKKCKESSLPQNSELDSSCEKRYYMTQCTLQCQEGLTGIVNSSYMCNISVGESSPRWKMVGDQPWNCSKGK